MLAIVAALWGQLSPPDDPLAQDFAHILAGPSRAHLLGQDQFGRDVLSRLLAGAGPTLFVSSMSTLLACLLGIPYGAFCAVSGRWGLACSRLLDGIQAFPGILLALVLTAVLEPSYRTLIVALGISFFPIIARVTEAVVQSERTRDYALAAKTIGLSPSRVLLIHVLPNGASALLVQATTVLALGILSEAALSFLGLGPSPSSPTWGRMIYDAQSTMELAPHTALAPLATISLLVLGVNLLGDGLRDALDPTVSAQRLV